MDFYQNQVELATDALAIVIPDNTTAFPAVTRLTLPIVLEIVLQTTPTELLLI